MWGLYQVQETSIDRDGSHENEPYDTLFPQSKGDSHSCEYRN